MADFRATENGGKMSLEHTVAWKQEVLKMTGHRSQLDPIPQQVR